jgi:hypothetical protein
VIDDDYSKPAQTDDEIFKECAARLAMAIEAESENRESGLDDRKFRYGDQWPDDARRERDLDKRPALTINMTDTLCRRVENNLRQQRPRIKVHPVSGGANVATAEVVEGLIRHIETASNAGVAYDTAGTSAVDIGWGYIRVMTEYVDERSFDQELVIRAVRNSLNVYRDPASVMPDGSDARWYVIAETMRREEYRRLYPRKDEPETFSGFTDPQYIEWDNKETVRLAEYFRIFEKPEKLYQMTDGSTRLESEMPNEAAREAANYHIAKDEAGNEITRRSSVRAVQWFRLEGTKVVDRRILPVEWIPVSCVEGNVVDLDGKAMRFGMVRNFRDPALMMNYWTTMQTERYALAPKAPWVVAEGQTEDHAEWDSANTRSYSKLTYKPVAGPDGVTALPPPERQPPVPVESGLEAAALQAERMLMAVAGMPQEGADGSRVVSGNKYLQRRQAMQDITHFHFYDNQSQAIAHVGRILLSWAPKVYDRKRLQRIIGVDGTPSVVTINDKQTVDGVVRVLNDVTIGRYDVVMDAGPGYQTKREEGEEAMIALLGTELGKLIAQSAPDLVIRSMDFAGAQDLADRLVGQSPEGMEKVLAGLPEQAQSIIRGLQAKLEQADQLIQQQHQEIKFKTSIEEMWRNFEREKLNKTDATKRHDVAERGHTAVAVAEIHEAGQLMNTDKEAEHNRRAAKDLLESADRAEKTH